MLPGYKTTENHQRKPTTLGITDRTSENKTGDEIVITEGSPAVAPRLNRIDFDPILIDCSLMPLYIKES